MFLTKCIDKHTVLCCCCCCFRHPLPLKGLHLMIRKVYLLVKVACSWTRERWQREEENEIYYIERDRERTRGKESIQHTYIDVTLEYLNVVTWKWKNQRARETEAEATNKQTKKKEKRKKDTNRWQSVKCCTSRIQKHQYMIFLWKIHECILFK